MAEVQFIVGGLCYCCYLIVIMMAMMVKGVHKLIIIIITNTNTKVSARYFVSVGVVEKGFIIFLVWCCLVMYDLSCILKTITHSIITNNPIVVLSKFVIVYS